MTLTDVLSALFADAFGAAGLDRAFGAVKPADRPDLAQFQCNGALAAAKAAKQNPRTIAQGVCEKLSAHDAFEGLTVAGPGFININLTDAFIAAQLEDGEGSPWAPPTLERIVLDYGGPNVAKPLHVGHLRAAIIGEALKRIFRYCGHDVVGDVHLGDWGLPMGQLIDGLKREQPELDYFNDGIAGPFPDEPPISLADLERLYPDASAACKADEARAEAARLATAELQAGRPGYVALWRHFIDLSRPAIEREYQDLGVTFDLWKGESDADPLIPEMAAAFKDKGLVEESDGAQIVSVARPDDAKEIPPLILFKSDGSVLYGTTDLATIVDRVRALDPDRMLYVVDQRQGLHFEQVFRASDLGGLFPEERLEHIGFGTMNGKDGKPFKTRAGGVLKLRDLIDLVTEKARARIAESGLAKGYGEEEVESVARKVGVAALKFADLSNPRTSDYVFDLDRFVAFEGKTGPYLLYASVRVRSVLAKAADADIAPGSIQIEQDEERDLALALLAFGDALRNTHDRRLPHILCDHAFRVAQSFASFYAACRILDEADATRRSSRLSLAGLAGAQLDACLSLLGIEAPARM
ncbi:MAG: arginine--tRNA ligase [Pseudomonadota bacterium]